MKDEFVSVVDIFSDSDVVDGGAMITVPLAGTVQQHESAIVLE